jgi:hypothetical protein
LNKTLCGQRLRQTRGTALGLLGFHGPSGMTRAVPGRNWRAGVVVVLIPLLLLMLALGLGALGLMGLFVIACDKV